MLELTPEDHQSGLAIWKRGIFLLFWKNLAKSFMNTYNKQLLETWNANAEYQFCCNHCGDSFNLWLCFRRRDWNNWLFEGKNSEDSQIRLKKRSPAHFQRIVSQSLSRRNMRSNNASPPPSLLSEAFQHHLIFCYKSSPEKSYNLLKRLDPKEKANVKKVQFNLEGDRLFLANNSAWKIQQKKPPTSL